MKRMIITDENKTNINIFVNSNNVILRLYDDLTIIDKLQYSSVEYKKRCNIG